MTGAPIRRRRGGAWWIVVVDVLRDAYWTRNWLIAMVVILTAVAAVIAFVGQAVLPWTIYPAL